LKALVLIMDSRRTPGPEESAVVNWLNRHQIATVLALTKIDKLSRSRHQDCARSAAAALQVPQGDIILFSAKTRQGREELWHRIERLIAPVQANSRDD
ncbi:MAG: YihA family ribosome biogenesis GTP-binding protein, partial [Desulfobacterales bacterium]